MNFKDTADGDIADTLTSFMVSGEVLGRGQNRIVYRSRLNPSKVVKVQESHSDDYWHQNAVEWELWTTLTSMSSKYKKWLKYFAECYEISENGYVLVQEYIPSIPDKLDLSQYKIPNFFVDLQPRNFGIIKRSGKNTIVCRDYGVITGLIRVGLDNAKLVKPKWLLDYD